MRTQDPAKRERWRSLSSLYALKAGRPHPVHAYPSPTHERPEPSVRLGSVGEVTRVPYRTR